MDKGERPFHFSTLIASGYFAPAKQFDTNSSIFKIVRFTKYCLLPESEPANTTSLILPIQEIENHEINIDKSVP